MRNRSLRIALIAGLTLTLTPLAATATTSGPTAARGAPASKMKAEQRADALDRRATTVTLPTGDHVTLTGKPGSEKVTVAPAAKHGPGRALVTRREGSRIFVTPVVAEPYLGRFLDRDLFDVTRLAAAARKGDHLPVRISYRGSTPAAPGVKITSASEGTASGYLTSASTAAFGRALTAQWTADEKAGRPQRTSMFSGVTKVSSGLPRPNGTNRTASASRQAAATFPLTLRSIGADGLLTREASIYVFNAEDGNTFNDFPTITAGEGQIQVPKGTYTAMSGDWAYDRKTDHWTVRVTTVNEFKVTGSGQTLTIDHRKATATPSVSVPRPTTLKDMVLNWTRGDAAGHHSVSVAFAMDAGTTLLLAPSPPATVGRLSVAQYWNLTEPVAVPSYTYDLGVQDNKIAADLGHTFRAQDLATVQAAYYGEAWARNAATLRHPLLDGVYGGSWTVLARGMRRTEYAGVIGATPEWSEAVVTNLAAIDRGWMWGAYRRLPAGSTSSVDWLKGPMGAAIPTQTNTDGYRSCFGCRAGDALSLNLVPVMDSNLAHSGELATAEDGTPVSRFRLYQDRHLVSDTKDTLGGLFPVPAAKARYTAVLDVDRRLISAAQSTRTTTQLSFNSARNAGRTIGGNWYCDTDGGACKGLPIVQARLSLPLSIDGTLPAGKSTATVSVGQVQTATASPITSAQLQIRRGGLRWTSVKLTAVGGGKYQGVIDSTGMAGATMDVRFSGSDQAGSTYLQTVRRAYTVARPPR